MLNNDSNHSAVQNNTTTNNAARRAFNEGVFRQQIISPFAFVPAKHDDSMAKSVKASIVGQEQEYKFQVLKHDIGT